MCKREVVVERRAKPARLLTELASTLFVFLVIVEVI
jgi:hypothetical protein